jgi:Mrp family chromosome partitioning ATPase
MMGADERRAAVLGRVLEEYGAQYDFVLVESPPVLESADTLIAASLVPRAVIVAEAGQTRYEVVERVRRDLERAGATILCGVLNKHQRSIPAWVYRWLIQ